MNTEWIWVRRSLLLGFLVTNFMAIPGIFQPEAVLSMIGARPALAPVWPAFAFLLQFLVSWFLLPAAIAPTRYLPTVYLCVFSRFGYAFFWLCLYRCESPGTAPWIWRLELLLGVWQLILALKAAQTTTPSAD